jgi:hypothetical protein
MLIAILKRKANITFAKYINRANHDDISIGSSLSWNLAKIINIIIWAEKIIKL